MKDNKKHQIIFFSAEDRLKNILDSLTFTVFFLFLVKKAPEKQGLKKTLLKRETNTE